MSEYLIQGDTLKQMAIAIREKAGVSNEMIPDELICTVYSLKTDTDIGAPVHGVTFYDYDGTVLYSYTPREARALTALPEAPVHEGVEFYGWTHTLDEVRSTMKTLDVGATYTSNTTQLGFKIDEADATISINAKGTIVGDVLVDWGDGQTSTNLSTNVEMFSHVYTEAGEYTVKLTASTGKLYIGANSESVFIHDDYSKTALMSAVIGSNVGILKYYEVSELFCDCTALEKVMVCHGISTLGSAPFRKCKSLQFLILPRSVEYYSNYMCEYCDKLKMAICPCTYRTGGYVYASSLFYDCPLLQRFTFNEQTTSLDSLVFYRATSLEEIYFRPETPPTITSSTFTEIPTSCKIYVPIDSLDAYKTADVWSSYANRIYGTVF